MSQIEGLKFYIKREGEKGRLGKIKDAAQIAVNSPLRAHLIELGYYEGAKEEWQSFTGLVAGDFDGDGDFDGKDRRTIKEVNKQVHSDKVGNDQAIEERTRVEADAKE